MSRSDRGVMEVIYMTNENINQCVQENSNISAEENSKNQINDNFKYRLERAKEQGVKQVLQDLGVESIDEVKEIYRKLEETTKSYQQMKTEADKARNYEQKLEVLKSGFDEKFVDYIAYKLGQTENFTESLTKFKGENPQYLKNQSSGIRINTSPSFETTAQPAKSNDDLMNAWIKKQVLQI